MSYFKLHIAECFSELRDRDTRNLLRTVGPYYRVLSTLMGHCEHQHKTKLSAEKCLKRKQILMAARRKKAA